MAWKEIRNSESAFRDYSFPGICPRFCREATVTVHCAGIKSCKTDVENNYHPVGRKCSLLIQRKESTSMCMEDCPLVPEKYI